ncbi:MAG: LysM peptidoglycan-binding domain-containing protein [Salibacteraceae bacterium]
MGVIKSYFFTLVIVLLAHMSMAQEMPEVHKINGNKYYLHVVQPGNTLYGIGKQYNVEIKEIETHNPLIQELGLQVNQTLLIPVSRSNKRDFGGMIEQTKGYLSHEVQPKETLYSISKQYNTTLQELIEANPQVELNGLSIGAIVKVPIENIDAEREGDVVPATPDSLKSHIVLKGETLYNLSKKYNTTIDELNAVNNSFPIGLKEGMAIRIPGTRVEPDLTEEVLEDTIMQDTIVSFIPDSSTAFSVALLLPIDPSFPDSSGTNDFEISESQRVAISFYRGFQLAIDSLAKKRNVSVRLKVIDSGNDTVRLKAIIDEQQLEDVDVVIGPFYTEQFEMAADHLKTRGVPIICPIPKPSKILFKRPNTIKTTPSESMQLDAIAGFLAEKYIDSNVVLVNSNKFRDQDNVAFFKSRYNNALDLPDTITKDAVREVKLWDVNQETLKMRFPDSASYTVIVPSTDKVFVTKLLNELYELEYREKEKYAFRVIGLEEWHKYEQDLEIDFLHGLHVTLPITLFLDFEDYRIKAFFKSYYKSRGYEPNRFTVLGYDLGDYLLTQVQHQKMKWFSSPEIYSFNGLLMDFHFQRLMVNSGLENQGVKLYEYKNYRLKKFAKWPLQEMK